MPHRRQAFQISLVFHACFTKHDACLVKPDTTFHSSLTRTPQLYLWYLDLCYCVFGPGAMTDSLSWLVWYLYKFYYKDAIGFIGQSRGYSTTYYPRGKGEESRRILYDSGATFPNPIIPHHVRESCVHAEQEELHSSTQMMHLFRCEISDTPGTPLAALLT